MTTYVYRLIKKKQKLFALYTITNTLKLNIPSYLIFPSSFYDLDCGTTKTYHDDNVQTNRHCHYNSPSTKRRYLNRYCKRRKKPGQPASLFV